MNLSERILRIATSHWTERSCFALTLAAALTGESARSERQSSTAFCCLVV